MALPKPPKDFYRLGEIAEELGWTVDDILDYAEEEKIWLCANLRAPMVVTESINALSPLPQREEHYIFGVYILTAESICKLRSPIKDLQISFRVDPTKDEYPGVKFWYVTTESFQEYKEQLSLDSLVISEQEIKWLKKEYGLAVGGDQEERQPGNQAKEPLESWSKRLMEFVEPLKKDGLADEVIADRVRKKFLKIPDMKLGILLDRDIDEETRLNLLNKKFLLTDSKKEHYRYIGRKYPKSNNQTGE